ncbi:MAG: CoA transferase [Sciscionella sp.]|nr:CoA transferase [Sciscionella sp.]
MPLHGITVVALEQAVAAPFATRQLADLGARVIKIERPGSGDFARHFDTAVNGMSSHFVWLNRNKESLALDVKDAEQRQILEALLARADVFIQNLAPGAADRLNLSTDRLREDYPRLVVCGITGYGNDGPYRDKKAYDLLVQCETGFPAITGTAIDPVKSGIAIADIAGGMYAFSGILSALYQRETTGEGQSVEVSLFDALVEWMGYPLYYTMYGGAQPKRTGLAHATIAPYGPHQCGDRETIFLAVQNEREWRTLCEVVLGNTRIVDDDRFRDNSARVENRAELTKVIEREFQKFGIEIVEDKLKSAKIAHARLRDVRELAEHPQLMARDRWHHVDSPAGQVRTLAPPIGVAGQLPRMERIPAVGEDNARILAELGRVIDE